MLLSETKTLHTHKKGENNVRKKPIFTNLKKKDRAYRASSKSTRLFLTKYEKQHQSIMSQAMAHRGCFTIAEAQAEFQWNGEDWQQHPSLCHRFSMHIPRYASRKDGNP